VIWSIAAGISLVDNARTMIESTLERRSSRGGVDRLHRGDGRKRSEVPAGVAPRHRTEQSGEIRPERVPTFAGGGRPWRSPGI